MLEHGGKLRQAATQYGIALSEWLDLSTGINPNGWPVPSIPMQDWQRLPQDDDGLIETACAYYGCNHALPVAGSQAAIQALPRLRTPCRVGVVSPGYAEHALAWEKAGHKVVPASDDLDDFDVLVLINPNNPSGQTYSPDTLLEWHKQLAARGGWLVIDEAFMDCTPALSMAAHSHAPGLIVLRSIGKFFGLAGARVGFVLAQAVLLERLQDILGPWSVSGPARHITVQALRDLVWQAATRHELIAASERLAKLLTQHDLTPSGGSALFQRVQSACATGLHTDLARKGILTRLFTNPPAVRFGLPGSPHDWQRLQDTLLEIKPCNI